MTTLPVARILHREGRWSGPSETCTLDYDSRFLRRKRLITDAGSAFVVDLAQTTSLDHGDALETGDGTRIMIRAAPEEVLVVTGGNLARLAWHIGNRHTPCQIGAGHLVIRNDPVIARMLGHLGATLTMARQPFTPEGGAYGHGRTHAHEHGARGHAH